MKWKHATFVGFPAYAKLEEFGAAVWAAFGAPPYLVGSAIKKRDWRDIDVRLILDDAAFRKMFGKRTDVPKWNALCRAFCALGAEMTGLPIDFQIQSQAGANAHKGQRIAIGTGVRR